MAGKAARTKKKEKRKAEKKARKAARQALYEGYKQRGINTKSWRSQKKQKKSDVSTVDHPLGKCGNIGCTKCFEFNFKAFLVKGVPVGMPQKMWMKWNEISIG